MNFDLCPCPRHRELSFHPLLSSREMDAGEGIERIGIPLKPKRKVPVVIKKGADSTVGGCPFQQVVSPDGHGRSIW
ncbi:hypothetical protein TNCV_4061971 [Trichonephila clavipes]|nr:hypothetical protein TNCV_4061971 [Trichonephila clavipes]